MTSIPDNPRDQLLFFVDNPIVAGEPGGGAIIDGYTALLEALLGDGDDDGDFSAMAALFDSGPSLASAPMEGMPAGDSGKDGGQHDDHAGAEIGVVLGLISALAKGEIDI